MTRSSQRVVGIIVLLVLGMLALPVVAFFADTGDGGGAENWIIPVAVLAMAAVGLLAAFVGVLVFWFLLNGISGA